MNREHVHCTHRFGIQIPSLLHTTLFHLLAYGCPLVWENQISFSCGFPSTLWPELETDAVQASMVLPADCVCVWAVRDAARMMSGSTRCATLLRAQDFVIF